MKRHIARTGALIAFCILCTQARAESLFLGPANTALDINVVKVDTKYTVASVVNKIGKFTATGTPTYLGAPANAITGGSYTVEVFFDLTTGNIRTGDANKLLVTGTLNGMAQTFFSSTQLKFFGSGTEDTFDAIFGHNTGTVNTNSDVMTRIMGVSIGNFSDPSFKYTLTASSAIGNMIFDNAPTAGIEKGTANVWAPMPSAASGGLVLLLGFGVYSTLRRSNSQGWRRA